MAVMAPRENWSDERLDDLATRTDEGFREVKAEFRAVRTAMGETRAEISQVREGLGEVRTDLKGLRETMDAKFDGMNRTMQIGFGIIGGVLTAMLGLLGLIATQV